MAQINKKKKSPHPTQCLKRQIQQTLSFIFIFIFQWSSLNSLPLSSQSVLLQTLTPIWPPQLYSISPTLNLALSRSRPLPFFVSRFVLLIRLVHPFVQVSLFSFFVVDL
jgi:hypothetical protein